MPDIQKGKSKFCFFSKMSKLLKFLYIIDDFCRKPILSFYIKSS